MDRREAETTCTTFGSSLCSEESSTTTTTATATTNIQLLCSSSSNNTIKTDPQEEVKRYEARTSKEEEVIGSSPGQKSPTIATTNSWNVLQQTTTTGLEANESTAPSITLSPPPAQHTSLAKQLGRRLTAPLTKANIKRCHRKLANLQLHHHYNQRSHHAARDSSGHKPLTMKLLSSNSTVDLFRPNELESPALYESPIDAEGHYDKQERKSLVKNMLQSTTLEVCGDNKSKRSPEKCATTNLRQARRRKRLLFMRRSTKSAPG